MIQWNGSALENTDTTENPRKNYKEKRCDWVKCSICKREIKYKKDLKEHMIEKHGKVPKKSTGNQYKCVNCKREYNQEKEFTKHINENHITDVRKFCKDCNEKFRTNNNFEVHQKTVHTPNKRSNLVRSKKRQPNGHNGWTGSNRYHKKYQSDQYYNNNYNSGRGAPGQTQRHGQRYDDEYYGGPYSHGCPHDQHGGEWQAVQGERRYRNQRRYNQDDCQEKFSLSTQNRFSYLAKNERGGRMKY